MDIQQADGRLRDILGRLDNVIEDLTDTLKRFDGIAGNGSLSYNEESVMASIVDACQEAKKPLEHAKRNAGWYISGAPEP